MRSGLRGSLDEQVAVLAQIADDPDASDWVYRLIERGQ